MRNALIFSPDLDGHRQVYVFVISHILEELGFRVIIAGNNRRKTTNSYYINKLKEKEQILLLDTSNYEEGGLAISLTDFLLLQNKYMIELTIFPEADNHFSLFISQILSKKNKLQGKVVGIFMRPFYFYRRKLFFDKLRFLKHFPSRWKRDEQLFYDFFLKQFSLLDEALCIDEDFVHHHPYLKWLPDVFQQYAELVVQDEKPEQRIWIEKFKKFKENNQGRFLILYFGTAQDRRGYDQLLRLAQESGSCFVHCGLRDDHIPFTEDVQEIRSILGQENRLFETNEYIEDSICIEYFFKSVSHLVLPYKRFYGSSGVMLQALEFGIPVLTPNSGIIGYRTSTYNLGLTYEDSNSDSLKLVFERFRKIDPKSFQESILSYMSFQSVNQLKKVLINSFIEKEMKILQPTLHLSD